MVYQSEVVRTGAFPAPGNFGLWAGEPPTTSAG